MARIPDDEIERLNGKEPLAHPPGVNLRAAVAALRVDAALAAIEDAQQLVDTAAQALCAVTGIAYEYARVVELHEETRRAWYVVKDKAERLQRNGWLILDHDPDEREVGRWASVRERRKV